MARFVSNEPIYITEAEVLTVRPADPQVEWIAIKPTLSHGERNQLGGALIGVDHTVKALDARYDRYLEATTRLAIVAWRLFARGPDEQVLLDAEGNPLVVPLTPENIDKLNEEDPLVDRMLSEIAVRNPGLNRSATSAG